MPLIIPLSLGLMAALSIALAPTPLAPLLLPAVALLLYLIVVCHGPRQPGSRLPLHAYLYAAICSASVTTVVLSGLLLALYDTLPRHNPLGRSLFFLGTLALLGGGLLYFLRGRREDDRARTVARQTRAIAAVSLLTVTACMVLAALQPGRDGAPLDGIGVLLGLLCGAGGLLWSLFPAAALPWLRRDARA